MANNWKKVKVKEIASDNKGAIAIGPFGSRMKSDCYVSKGIPVIRGLNISSTKLFVGDFVYISADKAKELGNANVYPGDIIFPHRGAIGQVAIVPNDDIGHYVLSSSLMKLTVDTKLAIPEFVVYYFRSAAGEHEILQYASTVGTPGIGQPLASLRSMELPLPPLLEQKAIAHVLGTLDDRIELNRQMNETLEAMAQALFKSWFVDFDPVIDNALANGKEIPEELSEKAQARAALGDKRRPLPEEIRALFPNEFVYNEELGWIPKGWEAGLLSDIAKNPRRGLQATEIDSGTPYIGLQDMPHKSIALSSWGWSDEVASAKFSFNRGEILFGKLRPYFHKVGIAPVDGVCSTDILVVLPKEDEWFSVVLGYVTSPEFIEYVTAASTGTKMPRTNWKDMGSYGIILPERPAAKILTELFHQCVNKILLNIEQNQELSKLRDTLLPKLLSGELRIPDAEKIFERIAG